MSAQLIWKPYVQSTQMPLCGWEGAEASGMCLAPRSWRGGERMKGGSSAPWRILLLSSHLRENEASFQPRPTMLATLIFLEAAFLLIALQPLICHSPDEYKLKHNNERWRKHYTLCITLSSSPFLAWVGREWLTSKARLEGVYRGREGKEGLGVVETWPRHFQPRGKGRCLYIQPREQNWEAWGIIITPRGETDSSSTATKSASSWNSKTHSSIP